MINLNKALKITKDSTGQAQLMSSGLQRAFVKSKVSSDKLFRQEVKIQKLREETFLALKNSLRDARNNERRGGLLGTALGLGGAGSIGRRFRGGGGGLRGGGRAPKLPRGPLAKGLSKFGRIGPMAIASTGLDFFLRKQSGQSNVQAAGGAASGLAGFVGGAKFGATLGSFIAPGLGTAAGGLIGGAVGGLFGGNLFDRLYGQNILRAGSDLRRVREEDLTRQSKTLFGENLDKFEIVLNKFEKLAPELKKTKEKEDQIIFRLGRTSVSPTKFPMGKLITTFFDLLSIVVPQAQILKIGGKLNLANKSKILLKKKNANLLEQLSKSFRQNDSIILQKNKLQERIAAFIKAREFNLSNKGFREFSKRATNIFSKDGQNILRLSKQQVDIKKVVGETDFYLDFVRKAVKGTKDPKEIGKAIQTTSVFGQGLQKNIELLIKQGADPKVIQAFKKQFRRVELQQLRYQKKLNKLTNKLTIDQNTSSVRQAEKMLFDSKTALTKKQKDLTEAIGKILESSDPSDPIKFSKEQLEALKKLRLNYQDLVKRGKIKPDESITDFFNQVIENVSGKGSVGGILEFRKIIKKLPKRVLPKSNLPPSNIPGGMLGARFTGPQDGYLALLHGQERVVPEDNPHTRSRGTSGTMTQNIIVSTPSGGNNNQSSQPSMSGGGGGVRVFVREADPFTVANKYSQMIAGATV